jgi:N6-adenosine-specific RNA methylase IME4
MGRSADRHYPTMTLEELKRLPVMDLAADDCVLLCWTTDPWLAAGKTHELIRAWGFEPKTVGFYWTKLNADGTPFMGSGYWTRANPEQCLLATRGSPKRLSKGVRRWINAPRREHSRKPDETYSRIEKLCAGPYVELFARSSPRPVWDAWGNDVGKFKSTG